MNSSSCCDGVFLPYYYCDKHPVMVHVHHTSFATFFSLHSAVSARVAASRARAPGATLVRSLAEDALMKHSSQRDGEMDECQNSGGGGGVHHHPSAWLLSIHSLSFTHAGSHACSHTHTSLYHFAQTIDTVAFSAVARCQLYARHITSA